MFTESELRAMADQALNLAVGYETEILLSSAEGALTRFGESRITQNVSQGGGGMSARLLRAGKMGKASTGNLTADGIARCIATAKAAQEVSAVDKDLLPLIEPQTYQSKPNFFDATVEFSPEARADGIAQAVDFFQKEGLEGAGIFSNGGNGFAIANSNSLWAFHRKTNAAFSISAMSQDSSGWCEDTDPDIAKIDISRVAQTAARKALDSRNPSSIEPGAWTVVFEPAAVADFMLFLIWESFNGKAFVESRSPFTGKIGQKVLGDNITIVDDPYHPLTPGIPFDYEGMPRRAVPLIEKGVFKGVVHDRNTGAKASAASTGHALPQPDTNGPIPLNVIISPGESSLDEMISSTGKGVLVTRLHYCNILDPMKVTLTGMTRDGLFLIENGRISKGLKNMRFTESVLHILNNVEALSRQLYKTETFWGGGGTVTPAMKVNDFHFTSQTEN